MKNIKANY
jgi:superfamily I DNA and/or RNA helicase